MGGLRNSGERHRPRLDSYRGDRRRYRQDGKSRTDGAGDPDRTVGTARGDSRRDNLSRQPGLELCYRVDSVGGRRLRRLVKIVRMGEWGLVDGGTPGTTVQT